MRWFSTLHRSSSLEKSLREAAQETREQLGVETADLGIIFFSPAFRAEAIDLWPTLSSALPFRHAIGCTAGGVIGGGKEEEERSAVSLTAAVLPDVSIVPFQLSSEALPDGDAAPKAWRDRLGVTVESSPSFLVLSDPFSMDTDAFLGGLDFAYPGAVKVGGLASGAIKPGDNLLLSDARVLSRGAIGVALSGNIAVEAVVAQGCRPIGEPLSITGADGNVLIGVNNRPPLSYIQELYERLPERDQKLLQSSLFLGLLMDPFTNNPRQGDFLVRNIVGLDQANGFLAIGAPLRTGQTVQFHLRDAATSRDDLTLMLRNSRVAQPALASALPSPAGAMLFSCVGRGRRLYGKPDFDSGLFKSVLGSVPLGGFFCNGEIGPVGGKTYLHGYTSSIAVFSPRNPASTPT